MQNSVRRFERTWKPGASDMWNMLAPWLSGWPHGHGRCQATPARLATQFMTHDVSYLERSIIIASSRIKIRVATICERNDSASV